MEFKIITRGERLRTIRKELGLKQEDLSGEDITRNLISMIETDKASLTDKAAKVIYSNLKKEVAGKRIEKNVNIDEIFITEEEQVECVHGEFLKYIEAVGVKSEDKLDNMISLLNRYNMNEQKVIIYRMLGKVFKENNDLFRSYRYFYLANEFAVLVGLYNELHYKVIMNLAYSSSNVSQYAECIRMIENYLSNCENNISDYDLVRLLFNKSAVYKLLKKYDEALCVIEEIEDKYIDIIKKNDIGIKAFILKANCYREKAYFNKALKIHKNLLKNTNKSENKSKNEILILVNIIEISMIMEVDYNEYLELITEKIKADKNFESYFIAGEVCKVVAEAYEKNKQNDAYLEYLYRAIELAKDRKDKTILDESINKILDKAILNNDPDEIETARREILELLNLKLLKPNSKLLMKLIGYYMSKKKYDKVNGIINFCNDKVS